MVYDATEAASVSLPERKAVTIIAGFRCDEGIVICADTQETFQGAKHQVPKLRFEPTEWEGEHEMAAAFCGSGHGPFIDKIIENIWQEIQACSALDDACETAEKTIKETYREFGRIYQRGACPEVDLIFGIKASGASRLFSAAGPLLTEKPYSAWGSGKYMADFLAMRMYGNELNLRQLVILAAYILFQAKEHVDGCGGESHIAVLRNVGVSGRPHYKYIDEITDLLKFADGSIGEALIASADVEVSQSEVRRRLRDVISILENRRKRAADDFKNLRIMAKTIEPGVMAVIGQIPVDDVGIFMRSSARRSKRKQ